MITGRAIAIAKNGHTEPEATACVPIASGSV